MPPLAPMSTSSITRRLRATAARAASSVTARRPSPPPLQPRHLLSALATPEPGRDRRAASSQLSHHRRRTLSSSLSTTAPRTTSLRAVAAVALGLLIRPTYSTNLQACCAVLQSWVSRKFMTECVVLFPVAVTFFITWWFIQFVDGFSVPYMEKLESTYLDLVLLTSLVFIFLVGIFVSSWVGSPIFWVGEWFIKKMPFVRHIYPASKQVSTAISLGTIQSQVCIQWYKLFSSIMGLNIT